MPPSRTNPTASVDAAALAAATLRISGSLDPDTVLREAVDAARALTGARLGMIATVDEANAPETVSSNPASPRPRRRNWLSGRIASPCSGTCAGYPRRCAWTTWRPTCGTSG